MIVTSTNTIEGREVQHNFDPISATAAIGANALSEIGASLLEFASQIPLGFLRERFHNYENKINQVEIKKSLDCELNSYPLES